MCSLICHQVSSTPYIHIAGTKGKGTTCLYTENIILRHYKDTILEVGSLTSPHLTSVRGADSNQWQVYLGGAFLGILHVIIGQNERVPGEGTLRTNARISWLPCVASALRVSRGEGNVAIVETGTGGELDSTNVISTPVTTGITEIGFNHTNVLGNILKSIAWHKAGIFKAEVPAYSVPRQPEV